MNDQIAQSYRKHLELKKKKHAEMCAVRNTHILKCFDKIDATKVKARILDATQKGHTCLEIMQIKAEKHRFLFPFTVIWKMNCQEFRDTLHELHIVEQLRVLLEIPELTLEVTVAVPATRRASKRYGLLIRWPTYVDDTSHDPDSVAQGYSPTEEYANSDDHSRLSYQYDDEYSSFYSF